MGRIQGTSAPETLVGGSGRDEINGMGGNDIIKGGAGDDVVTGDAGDDYVYGDDGNDLVLGGPGSDHLHGGNGNDELTSGQGADYLDGGAGADTFRYRYQWDSSTAVLSSGDGGYDVAGVDTILDFQSGVDKIMLSDLDANVLTATGKRGSGNEAFVVVNTTDGVTPGHLTVSYDANTNITEINGYTNAQAGADVTIHVVGQINPATDILL